MRNIIIKVIILFLCNILAFYLEGKYCLIEKLINYLYNKLMGKRK
jgi:hypothetical protein